MTKRYHVAISVEIDRFADAKIAKDYLPMFLAAGAASTVAEVRRLCRHMRSGGYEAFPPCDSVDDKGHCQGHPA